MNVSALARAAAALAAAVALSGTLPARDGIAPAAADGRALNLGFEDGTLRDWTADGTAFARQPVEGDTVVKRRTDMKSAHDGKFWIGSYERSNDPPTGTLTSVKFRVTHPWASFLVGGGTRDLARVEIVEVAGGNVIFTEAGRERENLEPVAVDLSAHQGKDIFIRIVDASGRPWGHINFDDFRFHEKKPAIPSRQVFSGAPPPEASQQSPYLTPQEALKKMEVPEGFVVDLIAAEPDLVQPIAFCWDPRGRIWVVEGRTYPRRKGNPPAPRGDDASDLDKPSAAQLKDIFSGEDRILILEDSDGDGSFETRKVFLEKLNLVSGIELGFGGVCVGAAPYLLHFPLDQGGDKPAGDPRILLDGWGWQDTHETLNTFIWGPDGWLYGCHGVFTHSEVRVCGDSRDAGVSPARTAGVSPASEQKPAGQDARSTHRQDAGVTQRPRARINCGFWRFHPVRHEFEVFAHGTSNSWGLDYNEYGDWFAEACVIPHFWHVIQGAYYLRQSNPLGHFNPYVYTNIETIADHVHYIGATPHSGNAVSDAAGGGHAHAGLCIYNGDNFPPEYRGRPMFFNIHGQRINQEQLVPEGSGYVAKHLPDFLKTNDKNFTGVALKVGPDGAVYFIDWYDKQKCHRPQPDVWDRSNGRLYRVKYAKTWKPWNQDLAAVGADSLLELQKYPNEWAVRMSRRLIADRFATGDLALGEKLQGWGAYDPAKPPTPIEMMRQMWVMAVGGHGGGLGDRRWISPKFDERVRAYAVRSILLSPNPHPAFAAIPLRIARDDRSPIVRLALASALQRLPLDQRWEIAEALISHVEDAGDHNLPQMYWYAIEPLVPADTPRALALAEKSKIPLVAQNIARRAAESDGGTAHLVAAMSKEKTAGGLVHLMKATLEGLKGRTGVEAPANWDGAFNNIGEVAKTRADAKERAAELLGMRESLAVAFGDQRAFPQLREQVLDSKADVERRQTAFDTLVRGRDPDLGAIVLKLLDDPAMRLSALRALPQAMAK